MGYKILGFAVWQGGKWYLRRRFHGVGRKAAIALLGGLVIAGGVAAQRQQNSHQS
jgi:hypothetical protein